VTSPPSATCIALLHPTFAGRLACVDSRSRNPSQAGHIVWGVIRPH
jgi:hypothetical protein